MCGIAGFINVEHRPDEVEREAVLERMCRVIAHRGPDDQGTLIREQAALGMRRLSIIDLQRGHQPLSNEDGTIWIVFNGEIYNYRELQRDLEAGGHRFNTCSDTEAIVHAYEEYGAEAVEYLRGMFAFAIWDQQRRELFMARDRTGKKPLYYTVTQQGTFIFGSELKCLFEHPEFVRKIDVVALDAYLSFGYVPDPLTIFRDVHKLPPAHYLTLAPGEQPRVTQYWDFPFGKTSEPGPRREEDYLDELRALLDEAVRVRLVADVPLGAFLSGGIDSSTVVGLMARHMNQPVKTFSIGFQEDSYDELEYARLAAKHFRTDHHEFIVTPDICQLVDELVWHFDEPFADSSALPTYMVSKLAREHVTVALSGDGGDELFAGYERYVVDRRRKGFARLPRFIRRGLIQPVSRNLPHGALGRNYLSNVALDSVDRYIDSVSLITLLSKQALYSGDFLAQLDREYADNGAIFRNRPTESFRILAAQVRTDDPLDALLYLDSKTYLPGDILTKVDRMSMAVSLETRTPLLDHKLIEFVCGIPSSLKLNGEVTKSLFKRAVSELVPRELLERPKQGFGVPIQKWINQELREQIHGTLTGGRARGRGYFDSKHIELLLSEHERGRRDHSAQIWSLFMLELWHRKFIDAVPLPAGPLTGPQARAGEHHW